MPTATPPPAHPAIIDHQAYPHIIDIIIASSPPPSLHVLRAVSSEFKRRADAILFHHVVLHRNGTITAPHGRLPGPLSANHWGQEQEQSRWVDTLRTHARILDYAHPVAIGDAAYYDDSNSPEPNLYAALSNISLARRVTQTQFVLPFLKTLVDFVHLAACESPNRCHPTIHEQDYIWGWPGTMTRVLCIKYAEQRSLVSRRHLVWCHELHPDYPDQMMTIILSLNDNPAPPTPAHRTLTLWANQEYGILTPLVVELGKHVLYSKFTIVGVLEMRRGLLNLANDVDDEALEQLVIEGIQRAFEQCYSGHRSMEGEQNRTSQAIRFQSLAEYRAAVGDEQFQLHTSCPETVGDREGL